MPSQQSFIKNIFRDVSVYADLTIVSGKAPHEQESGVVAFDKHRNIAALLALGAIYHPDIRKHSGTYGDKVFHPRGTFIHALQGALLDIVCDH